MVLCRICSFVSHILAVLFIIMSLEYLKRLLSTNVFGVIKKDTFRAKGTVGGLEL